MAKADKSFGRNADKNKRYYACGKDKKNKERKMLAYEKHLAKAKDRALRREAKQAGVSV